MSDQAAPEAGAFVRRKRRGSEKRLRSQGVLVRLSPLEVAEAQAAASRAGLSLPSFARVQMLGKPALRGIRRAPAEAEHLARILSQIGKIGSNLNQIARAANMNLLSVSDYALLREETEGLQGLRAALMQALGRNP